MNNKINVMWIGNKEYISRFSRYANSEVPIQNWMRNRDIIAYLGLWAKLNNESFKGVEFYTFRNEAGKKVDYIKKISLLLLIL